MHVENSKTRGFSCLGLRHSYIDEDKERDRQTDRQSQINQTDR